MCTQAEVEVLQDCIQQRDRIGYNMRQTTDITFDIIFSLPPCQGDGPPWLSTLHSSPCSRISGQWLVPETGRLS